MLYRCLRRLKVLQKATWLKWVQTSRCCHLATLITVISLLLLHVLLLLLLLWRHRCTPQASSSAAAMWPLLRVTVTGREHRVITSSTAQRVETLHLISAGHMPPVIALHYRFICSAARVTHNALATHSVICRLSAWIHCFFSTANTLTLSSVFLSLSFFIFYISFA